MKFKNKNKIILVFPSFELSQLQKLSTRKEKQKKTYNDEVVEGWKG